MDNRDDGAANHLIGMRVPASMLTTTTGNMVDLSTFDGRTVMYAHLRTGRPDQPLLPGWNDISKVHAAALRNRVLCAIIMANANHLVPESFV